MTKDRILLISGLLVFLTVMGALIWILWTKRKLAGLRVQAATAEEKRKSLVENQQIQTNAEAIQKEENSQREIQLKLDSINLQISDLKKSYAEKLALIKNAVTWEELELK